MNTKAEQIRILSSAGLTDRETGGTFDPGAVGGAGERGYLQIHPVNVTDLEAHGYTWAEMFDPVANLDYGYNLFQRYGLAPWGGAC